MPRPPNIIPSIPLHVMLPQDVLGQLNLLLYSDVEGKVPLGAYQAFFVRKIREERTWKRLDLGALGLPEGSFIVGPKATIDLLVSKLTEKEPV